jgi:hypothetical protein
LDAAFEVEVEVVGVGSADTERSFNGVVVSEFPCRLGGEYVFTAIILYPPLVALGPGEEAVVCATELEVVLAYDGDCD